MNNEDKIQKIKTVLSAQEDADVNAQIHDLRIHMDMCHTQQERDQLVDWILAYTLLNDKNTTHEGKLVLMKDYPDVYDVWVYEQSKKFDITEVIKRNGKIIDSDTQDNP